MCPVFININKFKKVNQGKQTIKRLDLKKVSTMPSGGMQYYLNNAQDKQARKQV